MSESNRRGKKPTELAHSIWLAGLGAYGRAWDEAQDTIKRVEKGTSELFDELVAKGADIEQEAQSRMKKVSERADALSLEERIGRIRQSIGTTIFGQADEKLDLILDEIKGLKKEVATLKRELHKQDTPETH